jgi:mannose-6-phosphate isomerase
MAILKLTPSCKDYLWGGSRLRTDFGIKSDLEPLAEAWVLSCHPDGPSYLPDGTTLADYAAAHPEALGTDCAKFEQFPILTKFIDASSNLSIQVHPSNDYALKNEHQYGKSEMWYVLDCVPGAYLYYGFTHEISKEELAERIKNNTLTEVLNAVPVHKGDCFFIPSGTLHAICQGIVVAEVQQNSNVTFTVSPPQVSVPAPSVMSSETKLFSSAVPSNAPFLASTVKYSHWARWLPKSCLTGRVRRVTSSAFSTCRARGLPSAPTRP